jgi:hypothetical protein
MHKSKRSAWLFVLCLAIQGNFPLAEGNDKLQENFRDILNQCNLDPASVQKTTELERSQAALAAGSCIEDRLNMILGMLDQADPRRRDVVDAINKCTSLLSSMDASFTSYGCFVGATYALSRSGNSQAPNTAPEKKSDILNILRSCELELASARLQNPQVSTRQISKILMEKSAIDSTLNAFISSAGTGK